MPWFLKFAMGFLFIFVIGAVMIAWACMSTGWETLSRFAWGCVTAGAGLIASALLAMLSAVIHKRVAQIFVRTNGCVDFVVSGTPDFCQVRMTKRSNLQFPKSHKWRSQ